MDFNNTGAMRSPFSPRVRQAVGGRRPMSLSSSENNQSKFQQAEAEPAGDVIYKTPLLTVETHGLPLPVMVTEALTFGSGEVTVGMSSMWCWAVTGRRVVAWPHARSAAGPARELPLPQTDLAHRAELVSVFAAPGAAVPACVAVSPEGTVRCWGSVAAEGAFLDTSCELAGQECARLAAAPGALLLATTTCTLVLLTPTVQDGRAAVVCRTLRPPSGWLGGLGRRMSHMLFGNTPHADTRLVGVVCVGGSREAPHVALVAGGCALQVWRGGEVQAHALRGALADALPDAPADPAALDVRATPAGDLLLLLHAQHRYLIAHVSLADPARVSVRTLAALRGFAPDEPPRLLPLEPQPLLYAGGYVALAAGELERVALGADGDRVLGAELCAGRALIFTRKHGVLLVTVAGASAPEAGGGEARAPAHDDCDGQLTLFEIDPHEVARAATDARGKLKAAFLFHVRGEAAAAAALLRELGGPEPEGPLERAALAVAAELLDDAPAGDPRWAPGAAPALGASAALDVRRQLRDKRRALDLLAGFLRAAGLGARARAALGALAERLAAARALCALRAGPHARVLDAALGAACEPAHASEAAALAAGALGAADVCLRRVTRAPRVLRALATARAPAGPAPAAAHARATCELLAAVLSDVRAERAAWPPAAPEPDRALLTALAALHRRALEAARAVEGAARAQLLEATAALAAAVLWEAAPLPAAAYAALRREIIQPYVDDGQTERAAALAERFQELELLVELCVAGGDLPRLRDYFQRHEGMAELAYRWLAERGGRSAALLVRRLGDARLAGWLDAAPARAPLAALHRLQAAEPLAAAAALDVLAADTRSLARMQTAASLGKLCCEAAGRAGGEASSRLGELRARAAERLALAQAHHALRAAGGAPGDAVHSPEELVQMLCAAARGSVSEHTFRSALQMAAGRGELALQVWCGAVLCDDWAAPRAEPRDSVLRRLLLLLRATGAELDVVVPPLGELLSAPTLARVAEQPAARHALRHAYEALAGDVC